MQYRQMLSQYVNQNHEEQLHMHITWTPPKSLQLKKTLLFQKKAKFIHVFIRSTKCQFPEKNTPHLSGTSFPLFPVTCLVIQKRISHL